MIYRLALFIFFIFYLDNVNLNGNKGAILNEVRETRLSAHPDIMRFTTVDISLFTETLSINRDPLLGVGITDSLP